MIKKTTTRSTPPPRPFRQILDSDDWLLLVFLDEFQDSCWGGQSTSKFRTTLQTNREGGGEEKNQTTKHSMQQKQVRGRRRSEGKRWKPSRRQLVLFLLLSPCRLLRSRWQPLNQKEGVRMCGCEKGNRNQKRKTKLKWVENWNTEVPWLLMVAIQWSSRWKHWILPQKKRTISFHSEPVKQRRLCDGCYPMRRHLVDNGYFAVSEESVGSTEPGQIPSIQDVSFLVINGEREPHNCSEPRNTFWGDGFQSGSESIIFSQNACFQSAFQMI